jgi:hypothetical protein
VEKIAGKAREAEGPASLVASTAVTNRNERKSRTTLTTTAGQGDSVLKLADYERSDIIEVASNEWAIKRLFGEASIFGAYPGTEEIFPDGDRMRCNKRHARSRSGEYFSEPMVFLNVAAIIAAFVLGAFQVSWWIAFAICSAIVVGPYLLLIVFVTLTEFKDRMLVKRSPPANIENDKN